MNFKHSANLLLCVFSIAGLSAINLYAHAGPLRERLLEKRAERQQAQLDDDGSDSGEAALAPGVKVLRDIAYGNDKLQRFDVYLPQQANKAAADAPVILMVHGGGWYRGDKKMKPTVQNKAAYWVDKGFVFISANYRMVPQAAPLEQAKDVAAALAAAQRMASSWGADKSKFILMGHSAGAHLVAMVAASPSIAMEAGAAPWLGTVSLDSAALDVEQLMAAPHLGLYDRAFGKDPAYWRAASPYAAMQGRIAPFLAICSTQRKISCPHATRFVDKAAGFGTHAEVVGENFTHKEINDLLGKEENYTAQVDRFLGSLDTRIAALLPR